MPYTVYHNTVPDQITGELYLDQARDLAGFLNMQVIPGDDLWHVYGMFGDKRGAHALVDAMGGEARDFDEDGAMYPAVLAVPAWCWEVLHFLSERSGHDEYRILQVLVVNQLRAVYRIDPAMQAAVPAFPKALEED